MDDGHGQQGHRTMNDGHGQQGHGTMDDGHGQQRPETIDDGHWQQGFRSPVLDCAQVSTVKMLKYKELCCKFGLL